MSTFFGVIILTLVTLFFLLREKSGRHTTYKKKNQYEVKTHFEKITKEQKKVYYNDTSTWD